jgi:hypothetical protein
MVGYLGFLCRTVGVVLWSTLALSPAGAAKLHFQADGDAFKNSKLTLDWTLIGFVGDSLELRDGTHQIRVEGPQGYTLKMTLYVAGRDVKVMKSGYTAPNCAKERDVKWPTPTVQSDPRNNGVQIVTLLKPIFGDPTGRPGDCAAYMMVSCPKEKLIVTAKSDPQGAEIWIDDEQATIKTNTTLSVPYCNSAKSVSILLRMNGKTNCRQDISVSPDRRVMINCQLREP